jgi:hypothetical protein
VRTYLSAYDTGSWDAASTDLEGLMQKTKETAFRMGYHLQNRANLMHLFRSENYSGMNTSDIDQIPAHSTYDAISYILPGLSALDINLTCHCQISPRIPRDSYSWEEACCPSSCPPCRAASGLSSSGCCPPSSSVSP